MSCQVRIGSDVNVAHGHAANALTTPLQFRFDCVDRSLTRQHSYASSTDELAITITPVVVVVRPVEPGQTSRLAASFEAIKSIAADAYLACNQTAQMSVLTVIALCVGAMALSYLIWAIATEH